VLGYSPLEVGLAFLPSALVMGGLSLGYAEKLVMGFGARRSLITGLVLIGAGLVLFARTPVDGSYITDILPVMLLLGTGAGVSFPAMMTLAMSGATDQDAGLASGFVNTTVQVAGAIGLAVLATLASERSDGLAAAGESAAEALNGGYHLAYLVGAGLIAIAIGVAVVVLQPDAKRESGARRGEPAYAEG
jgi:MFS family permease